MVLQSDLLTDSTTNVTGPLIIFEQLLQVIAICILCPVIDIMPCMALKSINPHLGLAAAYSLVILVTA